MKLDEFLTYVDQDGVYQGPDEINKKTVSLRLPGLKSLGTLRRVGGTLILGEDIQSLGALESVACTLEIDSKYSVEAKHLKHVGGTCFVMKGCVEEFPELEWVNSLSASIIPRMPMIESNPFIHIDAYTGRRYKDMAYEVGNAQIPDLATKIAIKPYLKYLIERRLIG